MTSMAMADSKEDVKRNVSAIDEKVAESTEDSGGEEGVGGVDSVMTSSSPLSEDADCLFQAEAPCGGMQSPGGNTKRLSGPCYLKCLISDVIAGSVIGKAGAVINSIKEETGCFVRLSAPTCYYPNSPWRVLVASGSQTCLDRLIGTLVEKTRERLPPTSGAPSPSRDEDDGELEAHEPKQAVLVHLRIVAPKSAISAIIGTGGNVIKDLQQRCSAQIQVSNREEGMQERVLTVAGQPKNVVAAACELTRMLQNDPNLKESITVRYGTTPPVASPVPPPSSFMPPYFGSFLEPGMQQQYQASYYGPPFFLDGAGSGPRVPSSPGFPATFYDGSGGAFGYHTQVDPTMIGRGGGHFHRINRPCEIRMKIPESYVRRIIGRRRVGLAELQRCSGARVTLRSQTRDEKIAEELFHECCISGKIGAVHLAHLMLLQRIEFFRAQQQQ